MVYSNVGKNIQKYVSFVSSLIQLQFPTLICLTIVLSDFSHSTDSRQPVADSPVENCRCALHSTDGKNLPVHALSDVNWNALYANNDTDLEEAYFDGFFNFSLLPTCLKHETPSGQQTLDHGSVLAADSP
jgi:hypothetical protein